MTTFYQVLKFYINSSIHVALSVVALAWVSLLHGGYPVDYGLLSFLFFGTITGYNFVKYAGIAKLYHTRLTRNLQVIQVFSLLSFVGFGYLAYQQSERVLWTATAFGILTFFYAVPFFPKKANLRSLKTLKIFVIAAVWAGVTVVIPWVDHLPVFHEAMLLRFAQYFFLIIALTIPFEIRDLDYDHASLGTLPQRIGIANAKRLGCLFIVLALGLALWQNTNFSLGLMPFLITAGVSSVLILLTKQRQGVYYTAFWIEGIPILWAVLEIVLQGLR